MTWGGDLAAHFTSSRWSAKWIWAPDEPCDGRCVVALRRDFVLDRLLPSVPARIAAVARYVLFVNGTDIARGPMRGSRRRQPFDLFDLAPHLAPGRNAIGAIAWIYTQATPWWIPPHPAARGAFALEADLENERLITDGRWSARTLAGWTLSAPEGTQGRGTELLDTSSLPVDWCVAGGPSDWDAAFERRSAMPGEWGRTQPPTDPTGPHLPRAVTWPRAEVKPLRPLGPDAWVTDEVIAGTVRVDIEGPYGETIAFNVAERLDADGAPQPTPDDSSFEVRCDGTRRTVETLDAYGLTGIALRASNQAAIHGVDVVERLHPVTGNASFACSDERLDRIWAVGRRTVTLCSWDAYLDCPTREQRAWVGDAVVHQMVDLTTNADWTLARWYPLMAGSPRVDGMLPMAVAGDIEHNDTVVIPDWSLHWVHAVWNVYRYVGDRDEIASLMPVVEGILRWFARFRDRDGLPTGVLGAVLIDWASVYVQDTSSSVCGLWGRALLEFAEMAGWLGDRSRAEWARSAHRQLKAGFEKLWDPKRRRYADVIVEGERRPMASQHGQASAIVGGLVPRRRLARLVDVLTDDTNLVHAAFSAPDGPAAPNSGIEVGGAFVQTGRAEPWWDVEREIVRAQPFFRYVVHDALVAAGRSDLIAAQCLDWTIALERCATSWTETWYGGTVCHGWSSTPTRDLVMHVLGIQPAEPGFSVANIDPNLGPLEWVTGSAPTPFGPIEVDVARDRIVVGAPVPFVCAGERYPAGQRTIATPGVPS